MRCLALFVLIGFVYAINIFHVNLTKFHINRQENEANLEWSNGIKKRIDLKKDIIYNDCIYNGQIGDEEKSHVLVTGCKNQIKHIQIHSKIFGDTLATIDLYGNIEVFSEPDLTDKIQDPDQFMDFSDNTRNSEPYDKNMKLPQSLTMDLNLYESTSWIKGICNRFPMDLQTFQKYCFLSLHIGKAINITGLYRLTNVINDECHSSNGYPCLFPFFYQGKSYNACIILNHDQYWCGTSYDSNGEDFYWGHCNKNCPIAGGYFWLLWF